MQCGGKIQSFDCWNRWYTQSSGVLRSLLQCKRWRSHSNEAKGRGKRKPWRKDSGKRNNSALVNELTWLWLAAEVAASTWRTGRPFQSRSPHPRRHRIQCSWQRGKLSVPTMCLRGSANVVAIKYWCTSERPDPHRPLCACCKSGHKTKWR
jgi:hypothetical protein